MEIGFGFLIGFMAGLVLAIVVAAIVVASRRAFRKAREGGDAGTGASPVPETAASYDGKAERRPTRVSRSGHTLVIEQVESQELQLEKSLREVRELLVRLADIVIGAGDASGKAAKTFNRAREVIDHMDVTNPKHLAEAQRVLIGEIDKVVKSNLSLHTELDQANRGIEDQRRQIEELRVQARIDGLTRIPNRASFDERLGEYIALLRRANLVFTLFLMDIDHFKRINDDKGHVSGDRILRGVATRISSSVRTNDFAARYGGEEFAVIFPGTTCDEAMEVAERIRQDIAKTKFRLDEDTIMLTLSGGLAECPKTASAEDVIAMADKALYRAKAEGRNRIVKDCDLDVR